MGCRSLADPLMALQGPEGGGGGGRGSSPSRTRAAAGPWLLCLQNCLESCEAFGVKVAPFADTAWSMLNDSYFTGVSLVYPPSKVWGWGGRVLNWGGGAGQ